MIFLSKISNFPCSKKYSKLIPTISKDFKNKSSQVFSKSSSLLYLSLIFILYKPPIKYLYYNQN